MVLKRGCLLSKTLSLLGSPIGLSGWRLEEKVGFSIAVHCRVLMWTVDLSGISNLQAVMVLERLCDFFFTGFKCDG